MSGKQARSFKWTNCRICGASIIVGKPCDVCPPKPAPSAAWSSSTWTPEPEFDSIAEADRGSAAGVGANHPDRAWILSDRDCWYPNPYYRGPAQPHPEDGPQDED